VSQSELLKKIINFLNNSGINYMLTGSLVSSIQGEPRSTHDIDIVVALNEGDTETLVKCFKPPDFYIDIDSAAEALDNTDMFNLIDVKNGDKIDFWIYTDNEFDRSRFARKYQETFEEIKMFVSSPEDTIIAKLNWSKLSGGSKKQIIDALRVYEIQSDSIDDDYLRLWVEKMELQKEWKAMFELMG
jgi:hypothetical protein